MGTFGDKNLLKLVCFIVKSSCYNPQIKVFLKSAAPEWAPHLKLWKFKERRSAQTSKYGMRVNPFMKTANSLKEIFPRSKKSTEIWRRK